MAIDLGTGDGAVVLHRARREPGTLVIGIDPVAAAMAEASSRAARPAHKGGLANALFVVAAVESLPGELAGLANEVTVVMPWGSLLAGILGGDRDILASIASLLRPSGRLVILLSIVERDGHPVIDPAGLDRTFATAGLRATSHGQATAAELRAVGSTWAKRLGAGSTDRPALRLVYERAGAASR
ncbi:MAG TPA: class I SAM-dependent methyltransferase [Candidatus Sulfotelmatobacter sp.]|nr:class I SAM-dependent methyltransferase [Candidatus Sulfotelmatobacter sp.]